MLMLTSALISACSCAGGGDAPKIYEEDISLTCIVDDKYKDNVTYTVDPVSGYLDITCHKEDHFIIEYNLTPAGTTCTQVNWSFSIKGLVESVKEKNNTKNQSAREKVEFAAVGIGSSVESSKTTLTFTTQELKKQSFVNITVFDKKENLPRFVSPENLDFKTQEVKNLSGDITGYNNVVTWDNIAHIYPKNSTVPTLAELSGGIAKGLRGYEVAITDEDNKEYTYSVGVIPQYPSKEMLERVGTDNEIEFLPLEDGKKYSIKVKAIGDNGNVVAGDYSDPISFYKLKTLPDNGITNNNGTISFTSPTLASKYQLKYLGIKEDKFVEGSTLPGQTESVVYSKIDINYSQNRLYKFSTIFYPENCTIGMKYYEDASGVRYYPSNPSKEFEVQSLKKVSITNIDTVVNKTIGGVTFENVSDSSKLAWSLDGIVYASKFGQKFRYSIYKAGESLPLSNWSKIVTNESNIRLAGLSTGSYRLEVETIGNAENTITSGKSTYDFTVIPDFSSSNAVLDGDILKINTTPYAIGGVELFFVSMDEANKSDLSSFKEFVFIGATGSASGAQEMEIDLSEYDLPNGSYYLYAKPKSYFNVTDNARNAIIVPHTLNNSLTEVYVVNGVNPSTTYITGDGIVTWGLVKDTIDNQYFYEYKLTYEVTTTDGTASHTIDLVDYSGGDKKYQYAINDTTKVASINIRELLDDYHNDSGSPVDVETEQGLFSSSNSFKFYITTSGYKDSNTDGRNDANYISSSKSPSGGIVFATHKPVEDIQLKDYKISFEPVASAINNQQKYIVGIRTVEQVSDGDNVKEVVKNEVKVGPFTGAINSDTGRVEINLNAVDFKALKDAINPSYHNIVFVQAVGFTGASTPGKLNSVESRRQFLCADMPTEVAVAKGTDNDYNLSWTVNSSSEKLYSIKFYVATKEGESVSYAPLELESSDAIKYTKIAKSEDGIEIGAVLADNIGKIIAIQVIEHHTNMFDSAPSEYIYATRMASPELAYVQEGTGNTAKYSIQWNNVNSATEYSVVANMEVDNDGVAEWQEKDTEDITPEPESTYQKYTINTSGDATSWGVGKYEIQVLAINDNDNANGSSFANAYIIASVPSKLPVYIASKVIEISVKSDGETLTWADVTAISGDKNIQANYSISVDDEDVIDNGTSRTYSAVGFDAGTSNVVVTPSINYEETGFIIIGSTDSNPINKWQKADNLKAYEGNLTFRVHGATDDDVIVIDIYNGASRLATKNYSISSNVVTDGSSNYLEYTVVLLDGVDAGELNLSVKVKSSGKLNSDMSDIYTGTKISAVNDLQLIEETLTDDVLAKYLVWTPVEGASQYEISYRLDGAVDKDGKPIYEYIKLAVEKTADGYTTQVYGSDEDGKTGEWKTLEDFIYDKDSDLFKYRFYEENIFGEGDKSVTGDVYFAIRPITSLAGYFSGNISSTYTITKLNSDIGIKAKDGKVNISNFVADGTYTPEYYTLAIYKIIEVEVEDTETELDPSEPAPAEEGDDESGDTESGPKYEEVRDTSNYYIVENVAYGTIDPIDLNVIVPNKTTLTGEALNNFFKDACTYEIELVLHGHNESADTGIAIDSATIIKQLTKKETTSLSTLEGGITWQTSDADNYTLKVTDSKGVSREFTIDELNKDGVLDESLLKYTIQVPVEDTGNGNGEGEDSGDSSTEPTSVQEADNDEGTGTGDSNNGTTTEDKEVLFVFEAGELYTLAIRVNKDGELHSNWSREFKVQRLYAPSALAISANSEPFEIDVTETVDNGDGSESTTPSKMTISVGAPIITWKKDNKNTQNVPFNYEIIYIGTDGKVAKSVIVDSPTNLIYAITTEMKVGKYEVKIKVFGNTCIGGHKHTASCYSTCTMVAGDTTHEHTEACGTCTNADNAVGLLTSFYSASVVANYIQDVKDAKVKSGSINWTSINGAYSYKVTAYEMTNYNQHFKDIEDKKETITELNAPKFEKYSVAPSMDFASTLLADLRSEAGSYTFEINAITDPSESIISTHADTEVANTASLFKPQPLGDYKVKDGMLNWRVLIDYERLSDEAKALYNPSVALSDVESFVTNHLAETNLTDVLDYVIDSIQKANSKESQPVEAEEEESALDDEKLAHLVKVNFVINNVKLPATYPTLAKLVDENGNETAVGNAKYIEYYYNIGIEPEITDNPNNEDDTEGDENTTEPTALNTTGTGSSNTNIEYVKGCYEIYVAPVGNSDTDVSIVNGAYTDKLVAYKPSAPTTYLSSSGADIDKGYVQWELPTTADSTSTKFDYHRNYAITAIPVNGERRVETTLSLGDNDIKANDDRYKKHLKDMFSASYAYNYETLKDGILDGMSNYGIVLDINAFTANIQAETGNTYIYGGIKYILSKDASYKYTLTRYLGSNEQDKTYTLTHTIELDTSILGETIITDPVYSYVNIIYNVTKTNDGNVIDSVELQNRNLIYNDNYRLLINVIGTRDSSLLPEGTPIYLNSNYCVVGNTANILDIPTNISFQNSNANWQSNVNVESTRLFIYGPFNNETITTVNDQTRGTHDTAWADFSESNTDFSEGILNTLYSLYLEDTAKFKYSIKDGEVDKYILRIVEITKEDGYLPNEYTLTNMIQNDMRFAPGGYIIQFQQLGDNKGVVDSVVTNLATTRKVGENTVSCAQYAVNKLPSVEAQYYEKVNADGGDASYGTWIGTEDSSIFKWESNSDTWGEKDTPTNSDGEPVDEKIGVFVWNPVVGANAYMIESFSFNDSTESENALYSAEYTRETRYEIRNSALYNNDNLDYFIKITAIRTADDENGDLDSTTSAPTLAQNFFSSDISESTKHARIAIPTGIEVDGTGEMTWEQSGLEYINNYRIRFNGYKDDKSAAQTEVIDTYEESEYVPVFTFEGNSAGKIDIAVKAMAKSGTGMLNSSYCIDVTVERLADPDIRLINGVFNWGYTDASSTPKTPTDIAIDFRSQNNVGSDAWKMDWISDADEQKTTIGDDEEYLTYLNYFTDITTHNENYKSEDDEELFTTGPHAFTVQYQGTQEGDTNSFYIASNIMTLTATKLSAPTIENVSVNITGKSTNMVKWTGDDYAKGYRVRAFSVVTAEEGKSQEKYYDFDISAETISNLKASGEDTNEYFYVADGYIYFKIDAIIGSDDNQFDIASNGGNIFIYVQALGSGVIVDAPEEYIDDYVARPEENVTLYLSSSYSTPTTIGLPPTPEFVSYKEDSGTLTWKVGDDTASAYNIKLITTYSLTDVTADDFNNYWMKTATTYGTANGAGVLQGSLLTNGEPLITYSEIESRQVLVYDANGKYNIWVTDIIRLDSKNYGNKTPTSYQLTVSGPSDYNFEITALAFPEGETASERYISAPLKYIKDCSFMAFSSGDGSEVYTYKVGDYASLNRIRHFLSRNFTITENISLETGNKNGTDHSGQKLWTPIAGTFTGSIDGNNKEIKDIYYLVDNNTYTIEDGKYSRYGIATSGSNGYLAFMENIGEGGIIKNLTLDINFNDTTSHDSYYMYYAGLAVQNRGAISNVAVTGSMSLKLTTLNNQMSTQVAGIVITNRGTIDNSNANMNITAYDNIKGRRSVNVGGIATNNYGTIENCYFAGEITSNTIGGIAAINEGTIDRCYVDNATLNVSDKPATSTIADDYKTAFAGGLVAVMRVQENATRDAIITNSYSKAVIKYSKTNNGSNLYIGGMISSITDSSSDYSVTITDCYVATNLVPQGTVPTTGITKYAMMPTSSGSTLTNNYFVIVSGDGFALDGGTRADESNDLSDQIKALNNLLNNAIYNVTADSTEYPTLKEQK